VIIENIGGGGSSLGAAAVAHSPPDGYSLLLGGTISHVNGALIKSRPLYDPVKDLTPITNVANAPLGIGIHPSLPVHSLKELVAYDKANPGKLSFGHVGIGSVNHLTGELFKSLTGTSDIVQVPYRGGAPAIADLISGQVPMAILAVTGQFLEFHRIGKVRVLAITSPSRLSSEGEIPTVSEEGFPDLTMGNSIGLFAPTGTPKMVIDRVA
jgi:tripartite-type tricarboxylate transporter receptor subunit TctC